VTTREFIKKYKVCCIGCLLDFMVFDRSIDEAKAFILAKESGWSDEKLQDFYGLTSVLTGRMHEESQEQLEERFEQLWLYDLGEEQTLEHFNRFLKARDKREAA